MIEVNLFQSRLEQLEFAQPWTPQAPSKFLKKTVLLLGVILLAGMISTSLILFSPLLMEKLTEIRNQSAPSLPASAPLARQTPAQIQSKGQRFKETVETRSPLPDRTVQEPMLTDALINKHQTPLNRMQLLNEIIIQYSVPVLFLKAINTYIPETIGMRLLAFDAPHSFYINGLTKNKKAVSDFHQRVRGAAHFKNVQLQNLISRKDLTSFEMIGKTDWKSNLGVEDWNKHKSFFIPENQISTYENRIKEIARKKKHQLLYLKPKGSYKTIDGKKTLYEAQLVTDYNDLLGFLEELKRLKKFIGISKLNIVPVPKNVQNGQSFVRVTVLLNFYSML